MKNELSIELSLNGNVVQMAKIAKKNINSTKNLLKIEIVKIGVEVQYMLAQTNKCREPIYIENLLCQLLI